MIGVGLSIVQLAVRQLLGFDPKSLFAANEPGVWYDPSDFSTMFQDSAGATPVTAMEQPVGLILDKSKGLVSSTKGGELPGTGSSNFTSPDSAAASITGDIDIRVKLRMNDWTPAASSLVLTKFTSSNLSYYFFVQTDGKLNFQTSANGTTQVGAVSTVATGLADGATKWLRVTRDVDNGASGNTTVFYVSDDGTTWTQLGDAVTNVGATSIYDGTGTLNIGGDSSGTFWLAGKVYRAQVYNGINGTLAVDFDPARYTSGATLTAATGEVWTINGSARITPDGNHAYQNTSTSRPVLSARYNLLTSTEDISAAAWTKTGATISSTDTIVATQAFGGVHQTTTKTGAAIQYTLTAEFSAGTVSVGRLTLAEAVIGSSGVGCDFTLTGPGSTGTPAAYGSGWVAGSATIQSIGDGWYRCTLTATTSTTTSVSGVSGHTGAAVSGNTIKSRKIDLRPADQAHLPYQRVNTATGYDADPSKFKPYLRFDGIDDWLVTPTITPGTDKAQVFAGVRKLSDATQITLEFSETINSGSGRFQIIVSQSDSIGIGFASRGTTVSGAVVPVSSFAAPVTGIVAGLGDISGDSAILRVNGTQVATNTADQGTGNYLAYPLYIGRRGGTTLPFNGHIYGLIVRFGANLPAGTIASTENWVAGKTGITL